MNNSGPGEVIAVDVHNTIVDSSNKLTAIVGINDVIVIDTPDALLICSKERDQEIKTIIERIEEENRLEYL